MNFPEMKYILWQEINVISLSSHQANWFYTKFLGSPNLGCEKIGRQTKNVFNNSAVLQIFHFCGFSNKRITTACQCIFDFGYAPFVL